MSDFEQEYHVIGDVAEPRPVTPQASWNQGAYDTLFEASRLPCDKTSSEEESSPKRKKPRREAATLATMATPTTPMAHLCWSNLKNTIDHIHRQYSADVIIGTVPDYRAIATQLQAVYSERAFVEALLQHTSDSTIKEAYDDSILYNNRVPNLSTPSSTNSPVEIKTEPVQTRPRRTAANAVAAAARNKLEDRDANRGFSVSLSATAIRALAATFELLPKVDVNQSAQLACQDKAVVNALAGLDQKLTNLGERDFLVNLLRQVGYHDGLLLSDLVTWWKTMCDSLLDQQRAAQVRVSNHMDQGSVTSGSKSNSNSDTLQAPSGGKTSDEENIMLDIDPTVQIGLWKLLAQLREVQRADPQLAHSEARQQRARATLTKYIEQLVKDMDGGDDGVIQNIANLAGLHQGRPIAEVARKVALITAKHIPVQYAVMRKSLMSIYLFLSELKTNNVTLESRKMDNMIQGQLAYQQEFLRQHKLANSFSEAVCWSKCNIFRVHFTLNELPDNSNTKNVNIELLLQDLFDFVSVDPGIADAALGVDNSIVALELSVPKVDNIVMVSDAMLLVEYLRRQWVRYRNMFGEGIRWTTFCRIMGSSSSTENRISKPLRRSASLITERAEIQEVYRRPFEVEMRELKDLLDTFRDDVDNWTPEKTLEAIEQLKTWRIRTVSILELITKLSDCCECLRATSMSSDRQAELLSVFVLGLKTQIDPTQDSEVLNTFEDYVTRRFHFDYSKASFDSGWSLSMFAAALHYFLNVLTTQSSSPDSNGNKSGQSGDSDDTRPATSSNPSSSSQGSKRRRG